MSKSAKRTRQTGQALVEWMVVVTLATLAVAWAAGEFSQRAERAAAQGYAHWLKATASVLADVMRQEDAGATDGPSMFAGLPANQLVDAQPWLERLKQHAWLARSMTVAPKMPYDIKLLRLQGADDCAQQACVTNLFLLALPQSSQTVPHPGAMLENLDGQGLAVTQLAPDRLQGLAYKLPNPLATDLALPVGTIGLLSWRSDRPPPFVRLKESRLVSLDGGLLLGRVQRKGDACEPEGALMRDELDVVLICQYGRWQPLSLQHDNLRSCLASSGRRDDFIREGLLRVSGFWGMFDFEAPAPPPEPACRCPSGFIPIAPGSRYAHGRSVGLRNGYVCQRL